MGQRLKEGERKRPIDIRGKSNLGRRNRKYKDLEAGWGYLVGQ